jgi:hypothetical protein
LEAISKKPLHKAPARLQRMFLQLQKYDLNIIHIPGKQIPVADTLSRKYPPTESRETLEDPDFNVHCILKNMPVSDSKMEEIREATAADPVLQAVQSIIQNGWPEKRQQCDSKTLAYWNFRDELSVVDGILLKGEKVIIPKSLQSEMLQKVHTSHLGMEKCKQRARNVLFWPGMAADIEQFIATCPTCNSKANSNSKEPLLPHDVPSRPWQKVGVDLFTWSNRNYLVTVDYYSRFFEVDELPKTTAGSVVNKLSVHFSRHGIPEYVISDNGPQFSSQTFKNFALKWDFRHITSSPGYPQSNGLAEKTVQIVKNILEKANCDSRNALLSILEYRNTPVDNFASPAQLLMGRQLRSILPVTSEQLEPKTIDSEKFITRRHHLQFTQKKYYNKGAHPLPELKTGDAVRIQLAKGDKWKPGCVSSTCSQPRSYLVRTDDGAVYRRNRRFLRLTRP